jgi:sulfur relay (sulfurtransferase) DsrC/TusE family protein
LDLFAGPVKQAISLATSIATSYVYQADSDPHISAQHPRRPERTDRGTARKGGSKHNPERRSLCSLVSFATNRGGGTMKTAQEVHDPFDDNGFLVDPDLWDRDLALRIADQLGIAKLGDKHWAVIDYLRGDFLANATPPLEEDVCGELDLVEDCVRRLFGGAIEAWKVAGLPDPDEDARTFMRDL